MLNLARLKVEELDVDEVLADSDSILKVGPIVSLRSVRRGVWYHRIRRAVSFVDWRFVVIAFAMVAIVVAPFLVVWM